LVLDAVGGISTGSHHSVIIMIVFIGGGVNAVLIENSVKQSAANR
jgi:hypothetical protein